MRSLSLPVFALVTLNALAPFQCGSNDADDAGRLEDTPGEVLYHLAGDFERAGDRAGRIRVLRYLVARHPKSRFARAAHEDLILLGAVSADAPPPGERDVPPADPAVPPADAPP